MKHTIIAIASILTSITFATAAEIKAPNGGRIVEAVTPHAEFLLTPERKIEIRFLDKNGKVVAPEGQIVTVVTGDRQHPAKLAFAKDGDKLVSDKAVPAGDNLPVILQIREKEGAKAATEKFKLNLANCPECDHPEYACTCEHE